MLTRNGKKPAKQNSLVSQAHSATFFLQRQLSSPSTKHKQAHSYSAVDTGFNFGNIPVLQPKLTIGQPNDKYEQEADRVADQVMRMPDSTTSTTTSQTGNNLIQRTCTTCANEYNAAAQEDRPVEQDNLCPKCQLQAKPVLQRQTENEEEEEELLQANGLPGQAPAMTPGVASGISTMRGGGHPLSPGMRAYMEPRFDHDFSQVRVHTDANAAGTARQISARAFTVGRDIAFGAGQYQPHSTAGRRLVAHELAHTIQQQASRPLRSAMVQRSSAPMVSRAPALQPAITLSTLPGAIGRIQRKLDPPGDCTEARHRALQNEVQKWCKGPPRGCKGTHSIAELEQRIANNSKCITARAAVNSACFRGGDSGHQDALQEAVNALMKCHTLLEKAKEKVKVPKTSPVTVPKVSPAAKRVVTTATVFGVIGGVLGAVIGGVGGGAGGTLVAPGVGTVGGAAAGGTAGAIEGAAIGATVGTAIGAGAQALYEWIVH